MSKVVKTEFLYIRGGDNVPVSELSEELQPKIKKSDDFFTHLNVLEEVGHLEGFTIYVRCIQLISKFVYDKNVARVTPCHK